MQVNYLKLMCEIVTFGNDLCFLLRPRSHVRDVPEQLLLSHQKGIGSRLQ